jgi:hypothetical protein
VQGQQAQTVLQVPLAVRNRHRGVRHFECPAFLAPVRVDNPACQARKAAFRIAFGGRVIPAEAGIQVPVGFSMGLAMAREIQVKWLVVLQPMSIRLYPTKPELATAYRDVDTPSNCALQGQP